MKYFSDAMEKVTGALKIIDNDHAYIHAGFFYTTDDIVTIATGASVYYGFTAPSGTKGRIHYRPAYMTSSADKLTISFYEDSVFTGGSAMTPRNHLRESTRTPLFIVAKGPSVSDEGTLIAQSYIPGATGTGGSRSGGESSAANEWVLVPGKKYLGKLTNGSTASNIVSLRLQWYEEGY